MNNKILKLAKDFEVQGSMSIINELLILLRDQQFENLLDIEDYLIVRKRELNK
ncbi:hypothetical protein [Brachyspira pilosicoli]|uniref:hypothetical protein n=1 Tax=Brachyspira pilosicoli TaxID=52584 RepID=UPI000E16A223|nr:hypothetical protein [Brachyspira pilosicoli]SUW05074.1 Uncharacterised protein [Brachyspira pilosicoli]SUW09071.1 Uncharacterised protein [Brachyspira pilosicoli]